MPAVTQLVLEGREESDDYSRPREEVMPPVDASEYKRRTRILWEHREVLAHIAAWAGQPLPEGLSEEEQVGVQEAEVIHTWLFRAVTAEQLEADLKGLAEKLP